MADIGAPRRVLLAPRPSTLRIEVPALLRWGSSADDSEMTTTDDHVPARR